jgi:hypothetical protein
MKKALFKIWIFALFLSPGFVYAQFAENSFYSYYSNDDWIQTGKKTLLSLSSTYYASPYSNPSYLNYFILLHYYADNLNNDIAIKLKKENYFGVVMGNTLRVLPVMHIKIRQRDFGLGLTIRNVYDQRIYFTDDLFTLIFEGNVPFAGKTASISPLDFKTISYQEAGINLISPSDKRLKFGIGLSYIKGSRFYEFSARRGKLFTSEEGDSLYADINVKYASSNPGNKGLFTYNGSGMGLSGYLVYDFNAKSSLFISVDDMGFIYWNNKSIDFKFDTSTSYIGYDLFDKNSIGTDQSLFIDTFFNIKDNPAHKSNFMMLNPSFNAVYTLKTGSKGSKLICGASYRIYKHNYPGAFVNYRYKPAKNLYLQGGISYDEFRKMGGNLELGLRLFKKWVFRLGSYHVEQFFVPFNGQSLYFDLTGVFGK